MTNVSRVTSCCICLRACRDSAPNATSVAPYADPIFVRSLFDPMTILLDENSGRWFRLLLVVVTDVSITPLFVPPTVSSPTAQSTNGSYTNASNSVNNVSRPFFNVFNTCSQARRKVPYIIVNDNRKEKKKKTMINDNENKNFKKCKRKWKERKQK